MPESTSSGENPFFALPSTVLGRVSAGLILAAIVFGVVVAVIVVTVAEPIVAREIDLTLGPVDVVPAIVFMAACAALVTGAVALIKYHERSLAVWLSTLLPAVVVAAEVLSWLIQGG